MDLIDVIDVIYWSEVTFCQACRGTRWNDASTGRTANAGEFVWYEPYSRAVIGSVVARQGSRVVRIYADDLPTGFVFVDNADISHRCSLPARPVTVGKPPVIDVTMVEAPIVVTVVESNLLAARDLI